MPNEAETGEEEDVIVSHCGSSPGTGSFGILYRFLINVIEWGVPEHSLITFSTLILRRKQQIDLFEGSWETRRTEVHDGDPESMAAVAFWGFFCVCWSVLKCFSEHWRGWSLSDTHAFGRKCDSDKAHYKQQRVRQKGGGRGGESGWNHESKDGSLKMTSWGVLGERRLRTMTNDLALKCILCAYVGLSISKNTVYL